MAWALRVQGGFAPLRGAVVRPRRVLYAGSFQHTLSDRQGGPDVRFSD